MNIREAAVGDIFAMYEIRFAVRENGFPDSAAATYKDSIAHLESLGKGWVCEDDGGVMLGFAFAENDGFIWALLVRPGHERRGIGTRLLDRCVAWLRQNGVKRAWLRTAPGTGAEQFYRRRGWRGSRRWWRREIKFTMDVNA
ncbi:MAG: GNAT family N-acetyltransferase [Alphaproteobacteria bacterium]